MYGLIEMRDLAIPQLITILRDTHSKAEVCLLSYCFFF